MKKYGKLTTNQNMKINTDFITSRGASRLNIYLIEKQGLDQSQVDQIKELHCQKDELYDKIEASGDPEILKEIEEIEYKLQDAWGFERNSMYHRHWEVPGCSCPAMDGADDIGFRKHYSLACPLHENKLKEYERA